MDASDITRPVRARDRRIEVLEDLVQDLLSRIPDEACCEPPSDCPNVHALDCPIPRAERVLKEARP